MQLLMYCEELMYLWFMLFLIEIFELLFIDDFVENYEVFMDSDLIEMDQIDLEMYDLFLLFDEEYFLDDENELGVCRICWFWYYINYGLQYLGIIRIMLQKIFGNRILY